MIPYEGSGIEKTRHAVGRLAFAVALLGLLTGTAAHLLGRPELSSPLFRTAFCVLLAMPVINVTAILAEEVARRDWVFVGVAGATKRGRSRPGFDVEGTASEVGQDGLEPRTPRLPSSVA